MRTLVLGGTRFIGRALVNDLVEAGHEVLVAQRGEHEPEELRPVPHLHVHRRQLASRSAELSAFAPEGVIDLSAMTARTRAPHSTRCRTAWRWWWRRAWTSIALSRRCGRAR
jgi:nucleoside-diphosphate-sugar epimerase